MARNAPVPVFDAVKRRWLVVLAVAFVAAFVAGAVTAVRNVTYTATATIAIDNSTLARTPGLAGGERILAELRTDGYYAMVASASGTDADAVSVGLRSYAEGQPIERIRISFAGADEIEARSVATAAADAAMGVIRELNSVERERHERNATVAAEAIAAIEDAGGAETPWEQADTAYKRWVLEDRIATSEYTIGLIDGAHRLEDGISVDRTSVLRSAVTNAVGAAVAGLFLGIGLAYMLERSSRTA
jgi:hypothetical protein